MTDSFFALDLAFAIDPAHVTVLRLYGRRAKPHGPERARYWEHE
jgi:hypothetical protein